MKVIGFCGYSGSGKTTLVEQLIGQLRGRGLRVSVVKHAHHAFDIDHAGKDSWRHRQAGAYEVVVASNRRLALIREYEAIAAPTVHELIAELSGCDWVLVEGFKRADLQKIEVWRAATGKPVQYPQDPFIVAVCTDSAPLPVPTDLPVLDLNDVGAVANFLLSDSARYEYQPPHLDSPDR
ncbi:MAG: molybdopterin-guanine dinucleotide biosynthesis protein B [Burkholderiaceae bacterium]|nr:molybdopterin-guanine dinucleotide biosynthesis protein B [Burkholderiaceae bacterium]